jgi:hypothetical protein
MEPNPDQLAVIEQFAWGEVSLEAMQATLTEMVGSPMRRNKKMRPFGLNQICPEPRIKITREHLDAVLRKRRSKQMSDQDLIDWSTMITINDVFYWDRNDDVLAESISHFHLDFFPED